MDLGVGEGRLSEAILGRHPHARVLGLDGSPAMRETATEALASYGERFAVADFRLEGRGWLADLPEPVRAFVSSLAIHHLDAQGKRRLFADLYRQLEPVGALLVVDLVEPVSEIQRRHYARLGRRRTAAVARVFGGYKGSG